jgi:hypothetical protein
MGENMAWMSALTFDWLDEIFTGGKHVENNHEALPRWSGWGYKDIKEKERGGNNSFAFSCLCGRPDFICF